MSSNNNKYKRKYERQWDAIDGRWINKATSDKFKAGDQFDEDGSFSNTRFGPTDDGFLIGTFVMEDNNEIVCKGTVPGFCIGAPYHIIGKVVEDKKWGIQVNITHAILAKPTGKNQVVAFLGSGALPGIGPMTAKRIFKLFGENTLDILENDIERLLEVPGIGEKLMKKLRESVPAQIKHREVIGFFAELGISMKTINRLIAEYGSGAVEQIKKNPYILCRVKGFAFTRADSIAMKMGIPKDDPNRLYAGVLQSLRWGCENNGHTLIPRNELIDLAQSKLMVNDINIITRALDKLIEDNKIIQDERGCHLKHLFHAERDIKHCMKNAIQQEHLITPSRVDELIQKCAHANGMSLTDEQEEAVKKLFSHKVSIMSAGAGCGKTYTCRMAVDVAKAAGLRVCLMSPTGRAAKHLSEVCGAPGFTMHRALSIAVKSAADDDFFAEDTVDISHNTKVAEAITHFKNSDIVIADEASMMDTEMAAILLRSCKNKHLMLVGDPNQLPSVGPGRVLGDLMESSYSQIHGLLTMLTKIFRQAEGSPVIAAAAKVQQGKSPVDVPGIKFYECSSNEEVQKKIEDFVLPYIKNKQLGYENYAFLAPIKKTPFSGVDALNRYLRPKLNVQYKAPQNEKQEFLFQPGDFVMQTKNNYDIDVFNGDIGIVTEVAKTGEVTVLFSGDEANDGVEYEKDEVYTEKQLIPAFAMTVHKSQGDQYDTVVLCLTTSMFAMLSRNLLYTAITRAENNLILIGDRKAFQMAAGNQKENKRMTGLKGI